MDEAVKLQFMFQTLGDANRLRIIRFIGAGERSVNEIVSATGLSQPLVSHHLRVLREHQVLEPRRQGPFVLYAIKDPRLLDVLGVFLQLTINIEKKTATQPMFCCPTWWQHHKSK